MKESWHKTMFLKRLTNQNFIICKLLALYIYNNIILYNVLHNNKAQGTKIAKKQIYCNKRKRTNK